MKRAYLLLSLVLVTIFFTACTMNTVEKPMSVKEKSNNIFQTNIAYITDQLLQNGIVDPQKDTISITNFINLNQEVQTNTLGMKLSNGMYDELQKRGFHLKDVRETGTFIMKPNGEIFIAKDNKVLNKKRVENSYILVATYSNMDGGTLVNARILDYKNGQVISLARALIDMNGYYMSNIPQHMPALQPIKVETMEQTPHISSTKKRTIKLSDANCKDEKCMNSGKETIKKEIAKVTKEEPLKVTPSYEIKKITDYK
jgi:TolB-like protein